MWGFGSSQLGSIAMSPSLNDLANKLPAAVSGAPRHPAQRSCVTMQAQLQEPLRWNRGEPEHSTSLVRLASWEGAA